MALELYLLLQHLAASSSRSDQTLPVQTVLGEAQTFRGRLIAPIKEAQINAPLLLALLSFALMFPCFYLQAFPMEAETKTCVNDLLRKDSQQSGRRKAGGEAKQNMASDEVSPQSDCSGSSSQGLLGSLALP